MTIAGKINALVLSISIAAGCMLTATAVQREYSLARERLIQQSRDSVQGQPQLQVALYLQDQPELLAALQGFINSSPAIRCEVNSPSAAKARLRREAPMRTTGLDQ